jgi:hypothetical protein
MSPSQMHSGIYGWFPVYTSLITLSIYLKGKAQQKIPSCRTLKGLIKLFILPIRDGPLFFWRGDGHFVNANNFFGGVVVANIFFAPASFCKQFVFVHRLIAMDFILN